MAGAFQSDAFQGDAFQAGAAVSVTAGVATLTLATFAPTVPVTDHQAVTAGVATLTVAAFAPTVSGIATIVGGHPPSLSIAVYLIPTVAGTASVFTEQ